MSLAFSNSISGSSIPENGEAVFRFQKTLVFSRAANLKFLKVIGLENGKQPAHFLGYWVRENGAILYKGDAHTLPQSDTVWQRRMIRKPPSPMSISINMADRLLRKPPIYVLSLILFLRRQ